MSDRHEYADGYSNAKNIYWFKKLVFAPLRYGFIVRVKSFILQSLTSEVAVHKKTSIFKKSNKNDNKVRIKIE